ncbi:uncharacterized protein J4E79_007358 [Alternaria viburni]|uniref:uncharacterized protein n=1 Tax=Alternaria viburni TaxID=566460 RepID=UPI0020C3948C|nr:uncharacterized protein J4E79_007358 [Alternaria viburni]KAI4657286.1 hypothetical protein J4E79_007358 [Alternaria viburni]
MASPAANTKAEPDMFQHSILPKEKGSFRLIQIRPGFSVDGLPDCYLQNALVQESNYICLSYTWGQPGDEYPIKLDGKLFHVRQNLYDFLQAARQRLTFCTLWIDALCINQTDVEERNHQVQQMGNIFEGARLVVSWLGNSLETQEFVQTVGLELDRQVWKTLEDFYHSKHYDQTHRSRYQGLKPNASIRSAKAHSLVEADTYDGHSLDSPFINKNYGYIANNAYWKRAWVTQEIVLARELVVMAGEHVIDFLSLAHACKSTRNWIPKNPLEEYAFLLQTQRGKDTRDRRSCPSLFNVDRDGTHGLLALLKFFSGKCCALRRDRIYSLLALCKGGEKIRVDYDEPDIKLIMQVLDACKYEVCFCSAATVARIVNGPGFSHLEMEAYAVPVTHGFKLQAYSSDLEICPSCSQPVPQSQHGVYFCLHCDSDACHEQQGHLFWDNARRDDVADSFRRRAGLLRLARKDLGEPRVLCRLGKGIEIDREEAEGEFYTLRFSLGTLVDVMNVKFEDEKQSYSSHTCRG